VKILLLRFSSIGDIVLTTPVIRCLKQQLPNTEIHFLTKESFKSILEFNPYLDKLITFSKSTDEVISGLKNEKYDLVIDLHKNIRSAKLKASLFRKNISFNKINLEKWLTVNTKKKSFLPNVHIVDRYMEAIKKLGIKNDEKGLDFFISKEDEFNFPNELQKDFVAFAIGAQFATKRLPIEKMISLLSNINHPVVLLGGKEDKETALKIISSLKDKTILNYCGELSIRQSAFVISKAKVVLTHDTGLMHIAAAFKKPIVSIWGNTIPEFGMYPYLPNQKELYDCVEVDNLKCRPCSKIGYQSCPKKHFDCMNKQDEAKIKLLLEKRF
jgi:ADP-heptose:LPS heptosyltransferase